MRASKPWFLCTFVVCDCLCLMKLIDISHLLGPLTTPEDVVTAGAAAIGCGCGTVITGCASRQHGTTLDSCWSSCCVNAYIVTTCNNLHSSCWFKETERSGVVTIKNSNIGRSQVPRYWSKDVESSDVRSSPPTLSSFRNLTANALHERRGLGTTECNRGVREGFKPDIKLSHHGCHDLESQINSVVEPHITNQSSGRQMLKLMSC